MFLRGSVAGLDLANTDADLDLDGYMWPDRQERFPTIARFNARNLDSNSYRSLLAGARRRRSPHRDPPYALNCPGAIQLAPN